MLYKTLVTLYQHLEATTKRLEKTALIATFLKTTKDLATVTLLLQGRVFPTWQEQKIGVATQLVIKAISKATGLTEKAILKVWKQTGDLGTTVQQALTNKSQTTLTGIPLTITKVHDNLQKLATLEGQGSVNKKTSLIAELLSSATPEEGLYIIRTVLEELRVGVKEGVLRDAIAKLLDKDNAATLVQEAYDITNDFGKVAEAARTNKLHTITLTVGKPLKVMLAIKATTIPEALKKVGTPAHIEYKLDGFRMQIHHDGKALTLFTRRLENVTAQFPDVVQKAQAIKGSKYILDAEIVGYDPKTNQYKPFQDISQRIRRKYDIAKLTKTLPVEINVFDILCYKGKPTLKLPLRERLALTRSMIKDIPRSLRIVPSIQTGNINEIQTFYNESIKEGNEGIMLKNCKAPYKPGARVGHMVKLKSTLDSLDLVIVGAEWGEGKRSAWLSSYTLACQDETGELLTLGKVATGLKEKEEGVTFATMTDLLKPLITKENGKTVHVKPHIVIEVTFEEIQKSPSYSSGYALRFPRFVALREEKPVEEIATLDMVEDAYYQQSKRTT